MTTPRIIDRGIDIAQLRHIKPVHYGRYLSVAAISGITIFILVSFARGDIDWAVTGQYLFWPSILWGMLNTIWIAIASMAIGTALGVLCAIGRSSANPVLRNVARSYAWLFRGTPVILQLLLWFNLALVFPHIGFGDWNVRTIYILSPVVATLLGLSLNEGAYISEIVRAGMLSVDRGQYEASMSIGMSYGKSLRRIVLPQAMRVIIPPLANEFIGLLKLTSLASIIGFSDVLHNAQDVYFENAKVIELLMVAGFWYLVVVSGLSIAQNALEHRFGRGHSLGTRR